MSVYDNLVAYKKEIETLISQGKNLREISQWSFEQREIGREVPYLMISQTVKDPSNGRKCIVTGIWASPIKKQKQLKEFFDEVAPGNTGLPRWTFTAFLSEKTNNFIVEFREKICKGKDETTYKYH